MDNEGMRKLLITASTFPRWENDTEPRFILDYAKAMTKYYDVTVLAPSAVGAGTKETIEGIKVLRYHYFPIHKWETLCYPGAIVPRIKEKRIRIFLVPFLLLALRFQLRKLSKQFDVIHHHWLIPQGICQIGIKGTPFIITGHGGDVASLNIGPLKSAKVKCMKEAIGVTAVSQPLADKMKELHPTVNPTVISMGVDCDNFGEQYRKEQFFSQGKGKVLLFVGRLAEKKGVTYLLDAMKNIDAKLVIVGNGPLRNELEEKAALLGDKVTFLGAKNHTELREIYASADIMVVPSVTAKDGDQEGLPVVVMEAMASGLPVVASMSGGISQMICDRENGLLCEEKNVAQLSDQINSILYDEELYEKLKKGSKETALLYDYSVIAEKYRNVIESKLK